MTIAGQWYNELNSCMTINIADDGTLTGTYVTGTPGAPGTFNLIGYADPEYSENCQSFGFTVTWLNDKGNCNSTTSWNGLYCPAINNKPEAITAIWLLSREGHTWDATLVGEDIFTRTQPGEEAIRKAVSLRRWSHPEAFTDKG